MTHKHTLHHNIHIVILLIIIIIYAPLWANCWVSSCPKFPTKTFSLQISAPDCSNIEITQNQTLLRINISQFKSRGERMVFKIREYEYEYYLVYQIWPNTNMNIIWLPKKDQIWIKILYCYPEMTEYEYAYHPALL